MGKNVATADIKLRAKAGNSPRTIIMMTNRYMGTSSFFGSLMSTSFLGAWAYK